MQTNTDKNIKLVDDNKEAIRVDKVNQARQNLEDGIYNNPTVIRKIVDKLLDEIG